MLVLRRSLTLLIITILFAGISVRAQDIPPAEAPTATAIPTDIPPTEIPPTEIPPTPIPPPTSVPTETFTPEPSLTPLPSPTDTPVPTATDTASPEPSLTPSETSTDAASPTLTASPSLTATASATVSLTPSMTASAQMQNQVGVIQPLANPISCTPSASIQQANVSTAGERGDVSGNMNSLSSDGRYLYFPSKAANLVVNDGNNAVDYFEFDRTNCNTRRITVGPNGEEGDGDSDVGNISGNGQYFAFASKASTFVASDSNGKYDIFVKNLSTNAVTRIPADPTDAISGAYYIGDVTISDDGRYVAFDVLVPAQTYTGFTGTPILYDTQSSTRTVIAAEGRNLYISGNGRYIAFVSSRSDLVSGDTNNVDDVFLYERSTTNVSRVSLAPDGSQFLMAYDYPSLSISGDGRYTSFTRPGSVYVRDRLANQTSLVSVDTNGTQIANALGTRLSADGRYVLFSASGIWIRDLTTSQTYQITNPYTSNGGLDISADGQYVAFSTTAGTSPNITRDVYVAKRSAFAPAAPIPTPTYTPLPNSTPQATGTYGAGTLACNPTGSMVSASVSSSNLQGFGDSSRPVISADGRYVAFVSFAANLVPNDTNGSPDVFRFDRLTCTTIRVSEAPDGTQGNGNSSFPTISSDGRYVAFDSFSSNLVSGDTNGQWDVFVRDLQLNTIKRIQVVPDNSTYATSGFPSISDDGRYVAFQSLIGSTIPIEVYDLSTDQRVTIASDGRDPVISGNGRYIAFTTNLNLVAGDTLNNTDLYVYDRQTSQYDRITPDGAVSYTYPPSISDDGRFVSFRSGASNLVTSDTNGYADIFVRDRQLGQTTRVSLATDGTQGNSYSEQPVISGDGRYVVFTSDATTLVAGDSGSFKDVFVHDNQTDQTYKISVSFGGALADGDSDYSVDISSDGAYIMFSSYAQNLVSGDINGKYDVFVAQRSFYAPATPTPQPGTATAYYYATQGAHMTATNVAVETYTAQTATAIAANCATAGAAPMQIASVSSGGVLGNGTSGDYYIALSDTGRYVVYLSSASNLVANDTNNKSDVFMFDRQTCQTTRLSTAINGDQANDATSAFAISSNAQIIAMHTLATNLVSGITTGGIYVRNLTANTLSYIPNTSQTIAFVSISGDGRYLTYTESPSTDTRVVVIYDLVTNQRLPIATMTAPAINSIWSKISSDGNNVVYRTETGTIYIFNRLTLQTISPSLGLDPVYDFDISANGRYVSFQSNSTVLAPNDTNGKADIFVVDTQSNQITRVSVASDGSEGNNTSAFASISPDGRYVTFVSTATNLVPGDNNNQSDVFVRDRTTNQTFAISARTNGTLGNASSGGYTIPISANNQYIAFFSYANNLVDGDTGFAGDVFVANLPAYQASGNATATAIAPATQTAGVPATQTAAAATATAGPFATQTSAAATATYIAANGLTVNTTSNTDDGNCNVSHCSLVEAVNASNAMVGVQTIQFNIPGTGVHTIALSSSLILTSSAIIDGTTQPGYSGVPLIELVPQSSTAAYSAINIYGATPITLHSSNPSVTIRGLIINSFSGFGIQVINGQQTLIEKNYIGTDKTGTIAKGNDTGIFITSPNNTIRDNVISGNKNTGIYMNSSGDLISTKSMIVGNYIGTDASGTNALPNQRGIRITEGASNNTIGGTAAGTANLISGNTFEGILIDGNTSNGNIITGNIIGLDANSQYLLGNGAGGITISGALNTVIGGATAAEGNDIWGNAYGISL